MKLFVLGASGMAGHVIATYFEEQGHDVSTLAARHQLNKQTRLLNLEDTALLKTELNSSDYDVVINCIGVLVKQSEEEKDRAVLLNALLPRALEEHYLNTSTKVVHISSDGVFSGQQNEYVESSLYDGQSFYSRSKALGEINNAKDLTVRTSIIGPQIDEGGIGFFNWFYKQTGEVQGFVNSYWKGVTTIELARAIATAIEQNVAGIYHLVPPKPISKYDLLKLMKQTFNKTGVNIIKAQGKTANANLRNTRNDFNYITPTYPQMCLDMLEWIENHPALYPHYKM